jgi:hypothetical protein
MGLSGLLDLKDFILLIAGAILGYIADRIVVRQTEPRKDLVLQTIGRQIIVESIDSYPFSVVDHNGSKLNNVYLINIRIWNRGTQHVLGSEISRDQPLLIHFEDGTKILGDPLVFRRRKSGDNIRLSVKEIKDGEYKLDFECLNRDEWAELGFFVKDNPFVKVTATGRIFGQESNFQVAMDDSRATLGDRVASFLLVLFVVSSPLNLAVGLFLLLQGYNPWDLIARPEAIPRYIFGLLMCGVIVPLTAGSYYFVNWLQRRRHPKTYPIGEDFQPRQLQHIGAMWGTALTGKQYGVSTSMHSIGEIIVPNEGSSARESPSRNPK